MLEIGQKYGGKTPSQVAINWVIGKGATPLVGVNNKNQLNEIIGALDWRLSAEDLQKLDEISESYQNFYSKTFYRFT
jgi:pyridoxine 4-dehydrogenase